MSSDRENHIAFFARTNFHDKRKIFRIRRDDRHAHMYVIGKTGSGKTTLLETLVRQDLKLGHGLMLLDPHGDMVERIAAAVPPERRNDVIYFNVPDISQRLGFNPMEQSHLFNKSLTVSNLLEIFKKLWADFWDPRLEHVLRNAFLALMDQPEATLADVLRMVDDREFCRKVVAETKQ
ncbi:MAG TPA: DUF87 domain-containing protein [Pyrinomonadaceae bacterium]|nr:DUF87 domain-containing protein [Pyrinomonadaceae bacterium]